MSDYIQTSLFDYSQLDSETRIVVQQRTTEIKALMKRTAQDIIEIGLKLIEVKERLPHGGFGPWLESEFGWGWTTATKFMNVARAFSNFQSSENLVMSFETLALLAAPSTPDEARKEAIDRAQQGETVTYTSARQIVEDHKNGKENALEDLYRQTSERQNAPDGVMTRIKQEWQELNPQPFNYKRDSKASHPVNIYEPQGLDACQTPAYAIDPLLPYLRPDWMIWEPAAGEGNIVGALYDAGYSQEQIVSGDLITGQNFFDYEPPAWDCLVTNPPYSIKFKWLERCYELGKPFALLLPVETLGTRTALEMFERYGIEWLFLKRRVDFKMPLKGWDASGAQFPTLWVTYRLIGQQITIAELNKVTEAAQ